MAAEKVVIDKIYVDDVMTKFGAGKKVSIYTQEYPGVKMSSFKRVDWKAGDTVEIEITKKGNFTNFNPVGALSQKSNIEYRRGPSLDERIKRLEDKVFPKVEVVDNPDNEDF